MKHQMIVVESLSFLSVLWSPMLMLQINILCRDGQHRYFIFLYSASVFSNYIWLTELQTKLGSYYCFGQSAIETLQEAHPVTRQG